MISCTDIEIFAHAKQKCPKLFRSTDTSIGTGLTNPGRVRSAWRRRTFGPPTIRETRLRRQLRKPHKMPGAVGRPKNLPVLTQLHLGRLRECSSLTKEGIPISFITLIVRRPSRQRASSIVPNLQPVQKRGREQFTPRSRVLNTVSGCALLSAVTDL
jgi:hypothetical protein